MGILDFFRRKTIQPQSLTTLNNPGWLSHWGNGGIPLFGESVSEETSMSVAAIYRCATLIAGTISALPLGVYQDDPELGRVPVPGKLGRLLSINPYPGRQLTSFNWVETLVLNLVLGGNGFSAIRWDGAARVAALEYCQPHQISVAVQDRRNIYRVRWPDERGEETIPQESMLHIAGPSLNGILGMSKIRQNARNAVAMARSIEEVAGKAFDQAMNPKNVLKLPPGISTEAAKALRAWITNEFSGKSNTGKTLFLDAGSEFDTLGISLVDLALIEAMKVSVTTIAMWFGVPPSLLGQPEATSWGTGISALLIAFLRFSLNSELQRIEAEMTSKLCTGNQYILFDRSALLEMDLQTSAEIAAKQVACGIATVNEIRRRNHNARVEGGDVAMTNGTNIPLTTAIQQQPRQATQPTPSKDEVSNDDRSTAL
jgi:HK97 family phage portal protein